MCTLPKDSTLILQHHLVNFWERIQQSIQKISCYTREVARKEQNIYPRYNDQRTQHLERPEGTLSIPHGAVLQCQGRGHHWRKGRSGAGETAQGWRALPVLPEDQSSVPSTYTTQPTIWNWSSRGSDTQLHIKIDLVFNYLYACFACVYFFITCVPGAGALQMDFHFQPYLLFGFCLFLLMSYYSYLGRNSAVYKHNQVFNLCLKP